MKALIAAVLAATSLIGASTLGAHAQSNLPALPSTTPPLPVPSDYGLSAPRAPMAQQPQQQAPARQMVQQPAQQQAPAQAQMRQPAPAPAPQAPAATMAQSDPGQGASPGYFQMGPAPARSGGPIVAPSVPQIPRQAARPAPRAPDVSRFLVPYARLRLEGELDRRSWVIFLTQDEAAKAATLSVGYINAVMVMPEASRLRVSFNGQQVLDTPITSSTRPARVTAQINPGVLRAGPNVVRLEALQRHRTDCNYQATYELWTDIVSNMTGLSFAGGGTQRLRSVDELPTVGVDAQGRTNLRVLLPGGINSQIADRAYQLAQTVAVRGRYPHPVVTMSDAEPATGLGSLNLILGTSADMSRMLGSGAGGRGVTFVNDARYTAPTIAVSGSSWNEVEGTINELAQPLLQRDPRTAGFLDTMTWLSPNVPIIDGAKSLRLSELDISTQEFSGRRFHMRFAIALPVDFYASSYGQAMLYLDAAYSSAVEQTSHFDVYVNGNIASTVDLDAGDGDILRHSPIKIPLKHFRPGVNEIVLEALLVTTDDQRCGPAATIPGANRLVVFDTTEFYMPSFARIARLPNLDAFSATAFPYNDAQGPSALVLGKQNAVTYSAAGTLLARLARQAGRPIRVDSSATMGSIGDRPALFVGLSSDLPADLFRDMGLSDSARTEWPLSGSEDRLPDQTADSEQKTAYSSVVPQTANNPALARQPTLPGQPPPDVFAGDDQPAGTRRVYDRWNEDLSGGRGLRGEVERLQGWFQRTFDISTSSMRIFSPATEMYDLDARSSVALAQNAGSGGTSPWTMVTARSPEALRDGLSRLTAPDMWSGVGGRITTYQPARQTIEVDPVASNFHFVVTQPIGFENARLILANWMSTNILFYALAVVVLCILLGIGTSEMLSRIGRRA